MFLHVVIFFRSSCFSPHFPSLFHFFLRLIPQLFSSRVLPTYNSTRATETVGDFCSKWSPVSCLSLRLLSVKLVMMCLLDTVHTGQAIWLRDIVTLAVVVGFSSRAKILGECSTFYSPSACAFFFFFLMEISSRTTSSTL